MAVELSVGGELSKDCLSLLVIGLSEGLEVGEADPPMRAHQPERELLLLEKRDEEGARDVEEVGRLLRGELSVDGDDGDGVAIGHLRGRDEVFVTSETSGTVSRMPHRF